MGRTLPTSTMLIQEFEESWRPYARALRKEDRQVLGELFAMVRFQSAAIAYASRPDPFQVFAIAMLGGMMKRVMHLETIAEREEIRGEEQGAAGGEQGVGGASSPSPLPGIFSVADGHPSERDWRPRDPPPVGPRIPDPGLRDGAQVPGLTSPDPGPSGWGGVMDSGFVT